MTHNLKRWERASLIRDFKAVAHRLLDNKARYQKVERATGFPWYVIAALHYRESNVDFTCNLVNGEPLTRITRLVPAGRGPYPNWEAAAVDATKVDPNHDWSLAGTLDYIERYNGLGYARRDLPSPYLWAGTSQYNKGKYVSDGKFDPNAVDKQLGAAGILKALMDLDPTVKPGDFILKMDLGEPPQVEKKKGNGVSVEVGGLVYEMVQQEIDMGKLSSLADRIVEARQHLEAEADKIAAKLDAMNKKADDAMNNANSIIDVNNTDIDLMDDCLRKLSNMPPEGPTHDS